MMLLAELRAIALAAQSGFRNYFCEVSDSQG
jgi:hypothetical protein